MSLPDSEYIPKNSFVMQELFEHFRDIFEQTYRFEGYDDLKVIVVESNAVCESDPSMKALVEQGYRFFDENRFGEVLSIMLF